ncbi:glycoside hydrolase family 5 protein [Jiangella endophytica]|uniref:glycoside hydrolase family 5 protein n=1 Tax=Jiangella endophytica TaxID=1623398 RepID=UPI000E35796B|nr:cellulase family glycosylhydrolase [Jiangella endophytica]
MTTGTAGPRTGPATFDGFVHADGDRLADGAGRRLQWRGMGLGNWLLPEGYMWVLTDGPQSPRAIESMVSTLVGPSRATEFWRRFRDVFVAEADIARLAAEGFDHVRLAINARVVMSDDGAPLDDGLALVDRLIDWCRAHRLWVVLDLHGAPGGQTGTNIDDAPNGRPELFEDAGHRERTIELWTMLARRYRDETVVAGYDLLNEPIPNDYQHHYADDLARLYRDLTTAIRAVDPNHLIIYEGSHWATNWSIFTEVWDPNSMLQFHKYWSPPDRPSIQQYLDARTRLGLPIYMGEGGENGLDWFQTMFQLLEDHEIGWNFWPWKKIDTATSPCSIDPPPGWPALTAWAAGRAPQPEADDAWKILDDLLDRMRLERCTYRPEVVGAMLRRAPLHLPATGFAFGTAGSSRPDDARPFPGFRSDDAVTIRFCGDGDPVWTHDPNRRYADQFEVVLDAGDWVEYEVSLGGPAVLDVEVELRGDAIPDLALDGVALATSGRTGRYRTPAPVTAGTHRLRVTATSDETALVGLEVT